MAYYVGDDIDVSAQFEVGGTLTDPTAWQIEVKPPGALASYVLAFGVDSELTKLAVGIFKARISTDRDTPGHAGRWSFFVTSTGTAKAAAPGQVIVEPSPTA